MLHINNEQIETKIKNITITITSKKIKKLTYRMYMLKMTKMFMKDLRENLNKWRNIQFL